MISEALDPVDAPEPVELTGPDRLCALTRTVKPIEGLLRFVAGPDGTVLPDIRNRLPGRGVWITLGETKLREAIKRRVFARGLKENVIIPDDLVETVHRLLQADCLQMLSFVNKAGAAVAGFEKIASGNWPIAALLQARDGSNSERARLRASCRGRGPDRGEPKVISAFNSNEIALSMGRDSVIHAALKVHPVSVSFLERANRYVEFLADSPAERGSIPAPGPSAIPEASGDPGPPST